MSKHLAVIGASGFVGSALTEYAMGHSDLVVTPFCHSTGGATSLAHRGLEIQQLDLLEPRKVKDVLQRFDYVVNCSRGGARLMLDGLANLLQAGRDANVAKLVHLSSVAVYGDPPPPTSTSEDAPTNPAPGSYGSMKLNQDKMVQQAASRGLRAVVLCPPNIVGPYSEYLIDTIRSIEAGRFRLIDEGSHPVNVVDVNNLSACILRALDSDVVDGRRLFCCEPEDIKWGDLCGELAPLVRGGSSILSMSAAEFAAIAGTSSQSPGKHHSVGMLKHLVSDEVRTALRLNPGFASIEKKAKRAVRRFGKGAEQRLRNSFNGPTKVTTGQTREVLDRALISQQLRDVKHNPERCQRELGFNPPLSFADSMQSFRDWYMTYLEADSPEWALLG
jgi:nucleoside-diphosphate-sugar epimerase